MYHPTRIVKRALIKVFHQSIHYVVEKFNAIILAVPYQKNQRNYLMEIQFKIIA